MSRCPSCNSAEAYVGILNVECVNVKCVHYSQKQKEEVAAEKAKKEQAVRTSSHGAAPKIKYRYYDDYDSCDSACADTSSLKDSENFDPYSWIDEHYNRDYGD